MNTTLTSRLRLTGLLILLTLIAAFPSVLPAETPPSSILSSQPLAHDRALPSATSYLKNIREGRQIEASNSPARASVSPDLFIGASLGTAWPIESGYVVTNNHVIADSTNVLLVDSFGQKFRAWTVARDEVNDIALLEVYDRGKLPPALPLSDLQAGLGASVFTIGFPRIDIMGKTPKLSNGIISSANGLRDDPMTYQTTVPIQPGNSGGPLLNMRGEVVGMIKSMIGIREETGGPVLTLQNTSCALKVDPIKQLMGFLPQKETVIDVLPRSSENLELLALRIQDSVLIVVAR
ncbi:MAG: serine protease [Desulfobacterales bacterium]|nr:serine protease [Desulfobacterales bacterium]MDD4072054.1 serine protease [Desulfobacterales bacterium]